MQVNEDTSRWEILITLYSGMSVPDPRWTYILAFAPRGDHYLSPLRQRLDPQEFDATKPNATSFRPDTERLTRLMTFSLTERRINGGQIEANSSIQDRYCGRIAIRI